MDVEMQVISPQQQISPPQSSPPPPVTQLPIKTVAVSSPTGQQQPLQNQVKLTTNFNFQYDDNGNLGRVDVSKALCYQSQEVSNNVVTKKVLVMHQKKAPILIAGQNGEQQDSPGAPPQHFVDLNNNLNSLPQLPSNVVENAHLPPPQQIFTPKNLNPHFIHPPYVNHMNWNPQFQ